MAQFVVPSLLPTASAGSLTYGMVRFDRMNASQATTGTVCAKTNANAQTEAAVGVTFPTGYTVSTTLTNWSVSTATTTSWPKDPVNGTTAATAWPGIAQPVAGQVVGQTVVFGSSDLAASTWYCFNWTNSAGVSIKSSATSSNTGIITTCNANTTNCAGLSTHTADLDTSNWATASVANTCGSGSQACDQIQVSASVNASFSFSLSATTAALGALSTSAPTASSAINATISTNAQRGWNVWAADLAGTPGLTSSSVSKTIAYSPAAGSAAAALTNGAEGYNVGVGTATGSTCTAVTNDANFDSASTSFKGGGLDNTMRSMAVSTGVANACALPITINASISPTTPAATDYAGTVTVVAAGRF